ncbi:HNH endonuclease signature motif containing protein [Pseudonocardia sp. GCM10023141]|uniref:HNH endonuclease signature motif containing protein n=1 Tax=Pseudonocardia sp. GCM10023141 TaxID=3252653 RepID=UPI00361063C5
MRRIGPRVATDRPASWGPRGAWIYGSFGSRWVAYPGFCRRSDAVDRVPRLYRRLAGGAGLREGTLPPVCALRAHGQYDAHNSSELQKYLPKHWMSNMCSSMMGSCPALPSPMRTAFFVRRPLRCDPWLSTAAMTSGLPPCGSGEGVGRQLTVLTVDTVAELQRRGAFVERGYKSVNRALVDQLGFEWAEARRHSVAVEQICPRVALDGAELPALLPATAEAFHAGAVTLRHVEVIAKVLASSAASRISPDDLAVVEAELASTAAETTPDRLFRHGTDLINLLDQDGPEPDDRDPQPVDDLQIRPNKNGSGGTIAGRFDSALKFATIAALLDAKSKPLGKEDSRTIGQRQADALADICGFVLDHGDVPHRGGHRPHLNVTIALQDLENRARAAMLEFGGALSPKELRMLACDSGIIPTVLGGSRQLLDIGQSTRTIPDAIRKALIIRDQGCAWPGCDRPPSWCDGHHLRYWEHGGPTSLDNCVLLCKAHHRLQHDSEWIIRIRDGLPEFIPPAWIDPQQVPRRNPATHLRRAA